MNAGDARRLEFAGTCPAPVPSYRIREGSSPIDGTSARQTAQPRACVGALPGGVFGDLGGGTPPALTRKTLRFGREVGHPWKMHAPYPHGTSSPATSRASIFGLVLGLLALLVFPVLMLVGPFVADREDVWLGYFVPTTLGVISAIAGLVLAIVGLARRAPGDTLGKLFGILAIVAVALSPITGLAATAFGLLMLTGGGPHGRPLRRRGEPVLPPAGPTPHEGPWRSADTPPVAVDALSPEVRRALAAAWLEDARTEHASVATFAHLTLDLLAIGAPPSLVARAQQAGAEEVHHATLAYGLASRYAGEALGPGSYPEAARGPLRAPTIAALAVESLVEGVVGEGAASAVLQLAATRTEDVHLRACLERMSREEASHAALAEDIVRYAVEREGLSLLNPLEASLAGELPPTSPREPQAELHRFGRAGDSDWRDALEAGRERARDLLRTLASETTRGAKGPRTNHRPLSARTACRGQGAVTTNTAVS